MSFVSFVQFATKARVTGEQCDKGASCPVAMGGTTSSTKQC